MKLSLVALVIATLTCSVRAKKGYYLRNCTPNKIGAWMTRPHIFDGSSKWYGIKPGAIEVWERTYGYKPRLTWKVNGKIHSQIWKGPYDSECGCIRGNGGFDDYCYFQMGSMYCGNCDTKKPAVPTKPKPKPKPSGPFYLVKQRTSWQKAKAFCAKQGDRLAIIRNRDDQKRAVDLCKATNRGCWIGLTKGAQKGRKASTFVWVDGSQNKFLNGDPIWGDRGEPNNYGGNQDCISMSVIDNYRWGDDLCSTLYDFLCERRSTSRSGFAAEASGTASGNANAWMVIGVVSLAACLFCVVCVGCVYGARNRGFKRISGVDTSRKETETSYLTVSS